MTETAKQITPGECLVMAFMHGIQSDLLPKDEVRHRIAGFRASKTYTEILKELEATEPTLTTTTNEDHQFFPVDGFLPSKCKCGLLEAEHTTANGEAEL